MRKPARLALAWLGGWALIAVIAPFLFYPSAIQIALDKALLPPDASHWFGTDALGRDLFLRVLCGSSVSLGICVSAVFLSLLIGAWIGAVAGSVGGAVEKILMGIADIFLCFPIFFLVLAVVAVVGTSTYHLIWILAASSWMGSARLVRGEALTLKEREFVLSSKIMGAGPTWIIRKHILPNTMRFLLVNGVLSLSGAILLEGSLSFLGLGAQPPVPSWGNLLMDSKSVMGYAWWISVFPGLAIFLTVLSLNTLGEELREKLHS